MLSTRGFTLIELMITIVLMALLLALGVPAFTEWIQNSQIRTYAESTLAGLQQARMEAVRRNAPVEFLLTSSVPEAANINSLAANAAGPNWVVRVFQAGGTYNADDFIAGRARAEGTANVTINASQSSLVFNGQGRLASGGGVTIDLGSSSAAATRPLRITVSPAGQVRLCDPALPATNVQSC
ncbi:MAG: GspH/FimT family pseudopilin [Burkholderiales bacterium]